MVLSGVDLQSSSSSTNSQASSLKNSSKTNSSKTSTQTQDSTERVGKRTLYKVFLVAAIGFSAIGTTFSAIATGISLASTVAAGASGIGAAAVVPGVIFTCLFGGLTVGGAILTSYLITELIA